MRSVTISIPEVLTMDGQPTPDVSEVDGKLIVAFECASNEAAVKTAKAAVRELAKYRLDKNVSGSRHQNTITLTFGDEGAELPATWRGRAGSAAATGTKPAILTELQTALKPYSKALYFNSSVNEGVVVEDVPVGLQFEADGGELTAKLLKSKKGEWTDVPVSGIDQAVALVVRLQGLTDLN